MREVTLLRVSRRTEETALSKAPRWRPSARDRSARKFDGVPAVGPDEGPAGSLRAEQRTGRGSEPCPKVPLSGASPQTQTLSLSPSQSPGRSNPISRYR